MTEKYLKITTFANKSPQWMEFAFMLTNCLADKCRYIKFVKNSRNNEIIGLAINQILNTVPGEAYRDFIQFKPYFYLIQKNRKFLIASSFVVETQHSRCIFFFEKLQRNIRSRKRVKRNPSEQQNLVKYVYHRNSVKMKYMLNIH